MKKRLSSLLCILLCISIFAGCEAITPATGQMKNIKLTEVYIPLPTLKEESVRLETVENEPVIYAQEEMMNGINLEKGKYKGYQWTGKTWEEIDLPWSEAAYEKQTNNSRSTQKGQDGKYYLLCSAPSKFSDNKNYILQLNRLNDKNQFEELKTEKEMFPLEGDGSEELVANFAVLDDNTILILYYRGDMVIRYDLNTCKKLNEFTVTSGALTVKNLFGNNFYSMNEEMDKILVNDVKTGEVQEIDFKIEDQDSRVGFCLDEEENLYIATNEGIFYKDNDSDEPECLMPASQQSIYALNDKENVILNGISKKDDNIYVSFVVRSDYSSEEKLYQYKMKK